MFSKRIRLSAAILAISFALLMASASEAKAGDIQFARCSSGRCVRVVGVIVRYYHPGTCYSSVTVMLDLVVGYFSLDSRCDYGMAPVDIYFHRFSISFSNFFISGNFRVGVPGIFTAHTFAYMDETIVGIGSFYNHVDVVK